MPDLPNMNTYDLDVHNHQHDPFSSCVTTSLKHASPVQEFLPVVHRLRLLPRLRSRLTQSGRAFLWKP